MAIAASRLARLTPPLPVMVFYSYNTSFQLLWGLRVSFTGFTAITVRFRFTVR
jgi:hypothetical protein